MARLLGRRLPEDKGARALLPLLRESRRPTAEGVQGCERQLFPLRSKALVAYHTPCELFW